MRGSFQEEHSVLTKTLIRTNLRISYTDNFRVAPFANSTATASACSWEILVDDVSCGSGALIYSSYSQGTQPLYIHSSSTFVGYCPNIPSGTHTLSVRVGLTANIDPSDCYTGWKSTFMLEVEEAK
ncbi:MAG: hypothetical protein Q9M92_03485 [Enterobacterales bacterium]|nr:hypothetical protein [Enterobacterales bacterium]